MNRLTHVSELTHGSRGHAGEAGGGDVGRRHRAQGHARAQGRREAAQGRARHLGGHDVADVLLLAALLLHDDLDDHEHEDRQEARLLLDEGGHDRHAARHRPRVRRRRRQARKKPHRPPRRLTAAPPHRRTAAPPRRRAALRRCRPPRALATHRYRSTPWACCCRGTIIVSAGGEGTQSISTWWTHQVYKDLKEAWNQSKQTVGVDIDG